MARDTEQGRAAAPAEAADLTKDLLPEDPAAPQAPVPSRRLPKGYPAWAHELADLYFSGTTSMFLLHGNVHDFVRGGAAEEAYLGLSPFLASRLFGSWDVVLRYDLARGLRPYAGRDRKRLGSMVEATAAMGDPAAWPHAPEKALLLLDRFLQRTMLADPSGAQAGGRKQARSVAILLEHAQYVVPDADIAALGTAIGARLVRLLDWAQNPYLKRLNIAFCLVADKLSEVNRRLVRNPYVASIEIPMPDGGERARYVRWATRDDAAFSDRSDYTPEALADVSNGLSLVNLDVVLSQVRTGHGRLDADRFRRLKKKTIEREVHGLLEFFEPSHGLDMVVGHEAAKARLRSDAALISRGDLAYAPMGYLICGPVGTGKTFLAECYAGSIGIPCVKLLNFRSKYVGETEGNLERVLTVLRSLGPVVVIIDEADAALGTREARGDSGTSARVFSMIASQMGDTRYRGRIVWMLLTSRPDRLPIDLKRQGRAEVHIPLFYPADPDEVREMFRVMARKNGVQTAPGAFDELDLQDRRLSGSDVESVVLGGNRRALADGRREVARADALAALEDFVPSAQGLEREAQELAAVLECTQRSFLPEAWRLRIDESNGRTRIQERFVAIRQILEER
ncbi:MAG: ATP-binding protein [Planctomycetota bacterium]